MQLKPQKEWKISSDKKRITECIVVGCKEKPYAEGLCSGHYDMKRNDLCQQ